MSIKLIAAVSQNNVIGTAKNKLPWEGKYKEDMDFFRSMTKGSTVIMGRRTYESIGRPLPKRNNIVISRNKVEGVETFDSLQEAIMYAQSEWLCDVWLIGGGSIYAEGMKYANEMFITLIPEIITGNDLVSFPNIDSTQFKVLDYVLLEGESKLRVAHYILHSICNSTA